MRILIILLSSNLLALASSTSWTQDKPASTPAPIALDAPALLKRKVGSWTFAGKMHMGGSQADYTGNSNFRMTAGGKWQAQDYSGRFSGQNYEAHGVTGFDEQRGIIVNTWYDSNGVVTPLEGNYDATGKKLVLKGSMNFGGPGFQPIEEVFTELDNDTFTFEMYAIAHDAKRTKVIELTYRRVKN